MDARQGARARASGSVDRRVCRSGVLRRARAMLRRPCDGALRGRRAAFRGDRASCRSLAPLEVCQSHHVGAEPTNTSVDSRRAAVPQGISTCGARAEPRRGDDQLPDARRVSSRSRRLPGSVAHVGEEPTVLAALFAYVRHQGDVWTYALNHLERYAAGMFSQDAASAQEPHALFTTQMQTLGRRIGELHHVLASATADPAFVPEPFDSADLSRWYSVTHSNAETALGAAAAAPEHVRRADAQPDRRAAGKPRCDCSGGSASCAASRSTR